MANTDIQAPIDGGAHGTQTLNLLNRNLGVGSIVFMVVAAAAPLAVVAANLPVLILHSVNPGAPIYFLICTALLIIFSVGFTLMSKYVPNAGAFYSYIQAGFGRILGTGAAAVAICGYLMLLIGVTAYFGVVATALISSYLGVDLPWWLLSLVLTGLVAWLGYRDIELSAKVLGVALVLEAAMVIVLDVAVIARNGAEGLPFAIPMSELTVGVPALGVMFAFYSFIGFEATAVFRNEARDPDRTIPRATYISVAAIGIFSAFSAWCVVIGVGTERVAEAAAADPENLVLDLMASTVGVVFANVVQVLLATSFLACALSFHNIVTRYVFALGRKRVLPAKFGEVHAKHSAPSRASLAVSVVATVFVAGTAIARLDPVNHVFTLAGATSSLSIVILMTLVSFAMIVFFRRVDTGKGLWHTLIAPLISALGLGSILVMVIVNFGLLTGTQAQAYSVMGFVVLCFIAGASAAAYFKRRKPEVYEGLLDEVGRPVSVTAE